METFDKASIAGVVAFVQNSAAATRKKVISGLLKDPFMRQVAKAILDSHEHAEKEKQTAAPETKETAMPPQPDALKSEFSAEEEQQRKREPDWIDPNLTKDWLKR